MRFHSWTNFAFAAGVHTSVKKLVVLHWPQLMINISYSSLIPCLRFMMGFYQALFYLHIIQEAVVVYPVL